MEMVFRKLVASLLIVTTALLAGCVELPVGAVPHVQANLSATGATSKLTEQPATDLTSNGKRLTTAAVDDRQSPVNVNSTMKITHDNQLERVSGVSFDGSMIKANVISNGCTTSADFTVDSKTDEGMCLVSISRTKPDLCRRAPFVVEIELEWAVPVNCADLDVVFLNPMLVTSTGGNLLKRTK